MPGEEPGQEEPGQELEEEPGQVLEGEQDLEVQVLGQDLWDEEVP